jgi:hypothetical protein
MRKSGFVALAGLAASFVIANGAAAAPRPVVVELFTAQGCASCMKANQTANQLAVRDGVIVLAMPVDYWDYLGWKDTLARPAFSARQRAYVRRLGLRGVSTPQVIVDGAAQASGSSRARIDALVAAARKAQAPAPQMLFREDGRVAIGSARAPKGGAEVWLVRFDPRARQVVVRTGENRGKTVIQRNVVRQLAKIGDWQGRSAVYRLPPGQAPTLKSYVLLQARGGRILGVLAEPVRRPDRPAAEAVEPEAPPTTEPETPG